MKSAILLVLIFVMIFQVSTGNALPTKEVTISTWVHVANWWVKNRTDSSLANTPTIPLRHDSLPGPGYSSLDVPTMIDQNKEMAFYGLTPLVSWWGPEGSIGDYKGDKFLNLYLGALRSENSPLKLLILYEPVDQLIEAPKDTYGFYDKDSEDNNYKRIISQFTHVLDILNKPENKNHVFTVDGKPVIFIWYTHTFKGPYFKEAMATVKAQHPFFLVGSDFNMGPYIRPDHADIFPAFDGISAYSLVDWGLMAQTNGHINQTFVDKYKYAVSKWSEWLHKNYPRIKLIPPANFSFFKLAPTENNPLNREQVLFSTPEETRNFLSAVYNIIAASISCDGNGNSNILPIVLFVSYNEHGEGTSAEPNNLFEYDYIEALRDCFSIPIQIYSDRCAETGHSQPHL